MELATYNIISAAFQPEDALKYELSILAGVDSFSYVVRDRSRNQLLAYHGKKLTEAEADDLSATLEQIVAKSPLLSGYQYGSVVLGWATQRLTLVPRELYDLDHSRGYLEQLTLLGLGDAVLEEWHNDLDAHLLFAVNATLLEETIRRFEALRSSHVAGGLLTSWRLSSLRREEASISASFRGAQLFVAAYRSGALQFFNTFSYDGAKDALYYILLAYEHCGMLPDRVPLYLSGEIIEQGEIYKLLYVYVRDISFSTHPASPKPANELVGVPPHLYFDHLCLG